MTHLSHSSHSYQSNCHNSQQPYASLQLFSGGGSRFGYYLGSYAALVESKKTPEVILATCGGSLSALLVKLCPDVKALHQLMCSEELHLAISQIQARQDIRRRHRLAIVTKALHRLYQSRTVPPTQASTSDPASESWKSLLQELQKLAMFDIHSMDMPNTNISSSNANTNSKIRSNTNWLLPVIEKAKSINVSLSASLSASATVTQETAHLDDAKSKKASEHTANPDIFIIASRLLSGENDYLLQQVLFGLPAQADIKNSNQPNQAPGQLRNKIDLSTFNDSAVSNSALTDSVLSNNGYFDLSASIHAHAPTRIHPKIDTVVLQDVTALTQSVRASMADMYYLPPIQISASANMIAADALPCASDHTPPWYLGGVIDLTPIELASQLAKTVYAETKAGYDSVLAAPAIQRVFGFNPNTRLKQVLSYQHPKGRIHWLPFADNAKALKGQHVQKRFNLRQGQLALKHGDHAGFIKQMQAQWDYGYQRTMRYLQALDENTKDSQK